MSEGSADKRDFFISFNQADRTWATWIAWVLNRRGVETPVGRRWHAQTVIRAVRRAAGDF